MGNSKNTPYNQKSTKKHVKQKNKPITTVPIFEKNETFTKKDGKPPKTTQITKKHTKNQLNTKQKHIYIFTSHIFTKFKTKKPPKTNPPPTTSCKTPPNIKTILNARFFNQKGAKLTPLKREKNVSVLTRPLYIIYFYIFF
jgi:hypothetical protein